MAVTSGSITTNEVSGRSITFSWWIPSGGQSVSGNYTDIDWSLTGSGSSGGYVYGGSFAVVTGGESIFYSATRIPLYQGTVIGSGRTRIYHSPDDGTCWFDIYIESAIYTHSINATKSGDWELPQILRYPTVSIASASKTLNTITLNVNYSVATPTKYHVYNGGTFLGEFTSTTMVLTGLTPNTTYSQLKVCGYANGGWGNFSSAWSVTTYDIAKVTSANDITDSQNPYFTFTNPSGSTIRAKLEYVVDGAGILVANRDNISNTGNYTFILTQAEKDILFSKMATSYTLSIRYVIANMSGTTELYTHSVDKIFTVNNSNPVFTNFTYKDVDSTIVALTGDNQTIVPRYSDLEVKIPLADRMIAQKGATGASYTIVAGTVTRDVEYSSTQVVSKIINNVNTYMISVFAKDSRNNQTQVTKILKYIDYIEPAIKSMQFNRKDGVGTTVEIVGKGTYSSVNFGLVSNTIQTIEYHSKLKYDSLWGDWIDIKNYFNINGSTFENKVTNELIGQSFDFGLEYDIEVRITDKLASYTFPLEISSGNVLMSAVKNKGVCFGGIYDEIFESALQIVGDSVVYGNQYLTGGIACNDASIFGTLDVGGNAALHLGNFLDKIYPIGVIYQSTVATSPATLFGGTWVQLTDRFLIGAGSTYAAGSAGGSTLMQSHSHTGGTSSNGEHNHNINFDQIWKFGGTNSIATTAGGPYGGAGFIQNSGNHSHTFTTNNTGGGNSENMPPYRAVYQWYRSA